LLFATYDQNLEILNLKFGTILPLAGGNQGVNSPWPGLAGSGRVLPGLTGPGRVCPSQAKWPLEIRIWQTSSVDWLDECT